MSIDVMVPAAPVLEAVERWLLTNRRDSLSEAQQRRLTDLRNGQRELTLRVADEFLCRIGEPGLLREIAPPPEGRGGYTWPNPHPLRKLSQAQVEACHVLHWQGGVTIRELGRQLWQRLGYSSPHSCAAAISKAFKRDALPTRDRLEAVRQVNDARGYVRGRDKRTYRRQKRAERRAADPAFRAEERARLDALHKREQVA